MATISMSLHDNEKPRLVTTGINGEFPWCYIEIDGGPVISIRHYNVDASERLAQRLQEGVNQMRAYQNNQTKEEVEERA